MTMKSTIPFAAIIVGFILLAGSVLWPILFPTTSAWTDEKSQQMSDLSSKAHKLHYQVELAKRKPNMTGGKNSAEMQEEYKKVLMELDVLKEQFQAADEGPKTMSSYLKWTGIIVFGIGVTGWMAFKG